MDDLLRHCMRELAFDGDFGCDIPRLQHFIEAFYSSPDSPGNQTVDEQFQAFVWSLLVQQPSVRVGLVPQGSPFEVYIAPQKGQDARSKKKMASEAASHSIREDHTGANDEEPETTSERLQLINDVGTNSVDSLIQRYGERLRIAVDPESSFRAVTGSHTRPAKLTPMVYTALQFISRGREDGLGVIELGKKSGYDQKTCFYLIKQLCELDLIVKLSKGGPGGGNFCIHKYFFERSKFWSSVRSEEVERDEFEEQSQEKDGEDLGDGGKMPDFSPIDSRHLTSIQLIKSRLSRLLKCSENGLHGYSNLLVSVGFKHPTKTDRRFFILRIRELIREGFVEKVFVPKAHTSSKTLCVRLVGEKRKSEEGGVIVLPAEVEDDEQEATTTEDNEGVCPVVNMNMTIHRQILNLLEEADHRGLTLHDISARLGNFDKRTVELILFRLERSPPPQHLGGLAVCDFFESQGRERRHRYYILPGYVSFIERENIDHAGRTAKYTSRDFNHSGEFYYLSEDLFYADQASLFAYENTYRDRANPPKRGRTRRLGRPRKADITSRRKKGSLDISPQEPRKERRQSANASASGAVEEDDPSDHNEARLKGAENGVRRKRKRNIDEENIEAGVRMPAKRKRVKQTSQENSRVVTIADEIGRNIQDTNSPSKGRLGHRSNAIENVSKALTDPTASSIKQRPNEAASVLDPESEPQVTASSTAAVPRESSEVIDKPDENLSMNPIVNVPATGLDTSAIFLGMHERSIPRSDDASREDSRSTLLKAVSKRRLEDHIATDGTPPLKRLKSERPRTLVNISQMRAENEFLQVLEAFEGIINISTKDFLEAHARVVAAMAGNGEPTSTPVGTQPDRRTIRKIFERLEERGRIKTLTVTAGRMEAHRVGQSHPIKIVYEPTVTQERLDRYLKNVQQDTPTLNASAYKMLEQPVKYTSSKRLSTRGPFRAEDGHLGDENGDEGWQRGLNVTELDDDTIKSTLSSEPQTIAQLYGYLVGKARRARELHQFTLTQLQSTDRSEYVVSQTERIISLPYYYNDLPASTYFAIVSAMEYSHELSEWMESPQGRQTPVKHLPSELHEKLKIGRARSRSKIFGLMTILTSLNLVTPLCPSKTALPTFHCEPNGDYPTSFDAVSIPTSETHLHTSAPLYWRFNTVAPIYQYSITEIWPPPFHRDMFVRTADESMPFWIELEDACLNRSATSVVTSMDSITGCCMCTFEVARTLRRRASWISSYVLSSMQKQYLRRCIDFSAGCTPLSDADGGRRRLEHICDIISAPVDAVYEFFIVSQSRIKNEMSRIHNRERKGWKGDKALADRALLAKKGTEARLQLEADWDALVKRVCPSSIPYGASSRLRLLRTRFLQARGSMDTEKWESAVQDTITGSKSWKLNHTLSNITPSVPHEALRHAGMARFPPVAADRHNKSVMELIDRQSERAVVLQAIPPKKRRKKDRSRKDTGNPEPEAAITSDLPRCQRFQWTPEYDELARDASAIIRSRCRAQRRMDWTALDQLFPFLPRNNVRQRIVVLRQGAGGESYLRLLEDQWHALWLEHRGTEALPDDNPTHPSEFDAITHVEFLRKHIDKRPIKVGLLNAGVKPTTGAVLTETFLEFISKWNVVERKRPFNKMDVVWNAIGDEHRENAFLGEAFSLSSDMCEIQSSSDPLSNGVAETALKMALATPEKDYDVDDATTFLNSIGSDAIGHASEELLARGVISETERSHRKTPGRKLRISSLNEDALGGPFHLDLYSDACAVEDTFDGDSDGLREWPVTATDGEMGTFIELVSAKKNEINIDISGPVEQRQHLDWNSRKVDDEQITTILTMRLHPLTPDKVGLQDSSQTSTPVVAAEKGSASGEHGIDFNGNLAPCRKMCQGIITCSACVNVEREEFLASLDLKNRKLSSEILEKIDKAGRDGLSREALSDLPLQMRMQLNKLVSGSAPQCYWVGYAYPVVVSRHHIKEWAVSIPGPSVPRIVLPRRWFTIKGEKMEHVWHAGLRAIVGTLVIRQGIPQHELRRQLISVYDRQEINDLLQYLRAEGFITKRNPPEDYGPYFEDIRAIDDHEERVTCWTLAWNPWYHVD